MNTTDEAASRRWQLQGRMACADVHGTDPAQAAGVVVMVHGAVHNRGVWSQQGAWLAEGGFATLAPDLPGHGQSDGPALANVAACAEWLLALLAAAGARRVALVGHSMGALVALEAAARSAREEGPVQVEALVLLGVAAPMSVAPAMLAAAQSQPLEAIDRMAAYSHARDAAEAREADRLLMLREQRLHEEAGRGNLLLRDLALCDAYGGALEAASRVACPSTLVTGTMDRMTPASATAGLAAALKPTRVELATGHNLMAEDPQGVRRALIQACAALGPAAGPLKP